MYFFIKAVAHILVFVLLILNAPVGAAHQEHRPDQNDEVKSLLHQFHEEIEHSASDEAKSKLNALLTEWLNNFNLYRISMDTHRWTQMKYYQDAGKSEYIRNFPVLASFYFLSHSIEMLSGPIGVYVASELGMGGTAKMVIGTVGAIISVPGLDPLCILFFAISPLNPMQKMFTGIRVAAVKVAGGVSNQLGLKKAMQNIFESKDRLNEIVKSTEGNINLVYDNSRDTLQKQMIMKTKAGEPYLILNFKVGTPVHGREKTFVESLKVVDSILLEQNRKDVDEMLSKMNASVRYALRQALSKPRQTFYVDELMIENNSTKIQFKDYAVLVKPQIALKSSVHNETVSLPRACKGLFH